MSFGTASAVALSMLAVFFLLRIVRRELGEDVLAYVSLVILISIILAVLWKAPLR